MMMPEQKFGHGHGPHGDVQVERCWPEVRPEDKPKMWIVRFIS